MAEFVIPEHPLLPEDERAELQDVFQKFAAAIESPDAESMTVFFAEQRPFFDSASPIQTMIFTLTMHQLGLLSDEEMNAAMSGVDLDEYIDVEDLELSDLGIEVDDDALPSEVL